MRRRLHHCAAVRSGAVAYSRRRRWRDKAPPGGARGARPSAQLSAGFGAANWRRRGVDDRSRAIGQLRRLCRRNESFGRGLRHSLGKSLKWGQGRATRRAGYLNGGGLQRGRGRRLGAGRRRRGREDPARRRRRGLRREHNQVGKTVLHGLRDFRRWKPDELFAGVRTFRRSDEGFSGAFLEPPERSSGSGLGGRDVRQGFSGRIPDQFPFLRRQHGDAVP